MQGFERYEPLTTGDTKVLEYFQSPHIIFIGNRGANPYVVGQMSDIYEVCIDALGPLGEDLILVLRCRPDRVEHTIDPLGFDPWAEHVTHGHGEYP